MPDKTYKLIELGDMPKATDHNGYEQIIRSSGETDAGRNIAVSGAKGSRD